MKTRTLLLLSVACALAILLAGGGLLWRLSEQPEATETVPIGVEASAGDAVVRLEDVRRDGVEVIATVEVGGVDDPGGLDGFRLALAGAALTARPEGCTGIAVVAQTCELVFTTDGTSAAGGLLIFSRAEDTVRWRI